MSIEFRSTFWVVCDEPGCDAYGPYSVISDIDARLLAHDAGWRRWTDIAPARPGEASEVERIDLCPTHRRLAKGPRRK